MKVSRLVQNWLLLRHGKARRAARMGSSPGMGGAPSFSARGQMDRFYLRITDYAGGTPDNIQTQDSTYQTGPWTNTATNPPPALDTPVLVTGAFHGGGSYWVRCRYQAGSQWSAWGTAQYVDVGSQPAAPSVECNGDFLSAEYQVTDYHLPDSYNTDGTIDALRVESAPYDSGPWALFTEGAAPAPNETVTPQQNGNNLAELFTPPVYLRFRFHDAELGKDSFWSDPQKYEQI
jgi:hypothetical protein